jgi:dCTP deaminase
VERTQLQPASLDLRLGRIGYRIRASFLPGASRTVQEQIESLALHEISLEGGQVLERHCVYLIELEEFLALPDSISAVANPKSSTGRLDVFTRLIADRADAFDTVPAGYRGKLYAEVAPRTFPIKVRQGSRLNQIRFRRYNSQQETHRTFRLSDRELRDLDARESVVTGDAIIRDGLVVTVGLSGAAGAVVGYRAKRHTGIVDVDEIARYELRHFWEPIQADGTSLILEPNEFYILASRERIRIPAEAAAEMVAFDPMMGEFRVHYAGFFDPGFGVTERREGSRAVLEIRSYEVPFVLEDGQPIGRLVFERLAEPPVRLYGAEIGSNYQAQGLKLSKHFREPGAAP